MKVTVKGWKVCCKMMEGRCKKKEGIDVKRGEKSSKSKEGRL
jgi:hypothetical protein